VSRLEAIQAGRECHRQSLRRCARSLSPDSAIHATSWRASTHLKALSTGYEGVAAARHSGRNAALSSTHLVASRSPCRCKQQVHPWAALGPHAAEFGVDGGGRRVRIPLFRGAGRSSCFMTPPGGAARRGSGDVGPVVLVGACIERAGIVATPGVEGSRSQLLERGTGAKEVHDFCCPDVSTGTSRVIAVVRATRDRAGLASERPVQHMT
jgi:hypothetical protein